MNITVTRNAKIDIKKIFAFIKQANGVAAARAKRKEIYDTIKYLNTFPQMGPISEEYENVPGEIRYLVCAPYRIFYQITENTIYIFRVADTRQK